MNHHAVQPARHIKLQLLQIISFRPFGIHIPDRRRGATKIT